MNARHEAMNARHDPLQVEVYRLAEACLRRDASPQEMARLDELVQNDPAARRHYLWYTLHATYLTDWAQCAATTGGDPVPVEEPALPATLRGEPEEGQPAPPVGLVRHVHWQRHPLIFSATVMVVWVSVLLVFAFSLLPSTQPPADELPGVASHRPTVARLFRSVDAVWSSENAGVFDGSFLRAGQRLDLQQGLAELRYPGGVRVILQGPCRFVVQQPGPQGDGYLEQGKLVAHVPDTARGFAVGTKLATIVDLGTEFGAEVDAGGTALVTVFEGVVQVEPAQSKTKTDATRLRAGQSVRLTESAAGEAPTLVSTTLGDKTFVRRLSDQKVPEISRRSMSINFGTGPETHLDRSQRVGVVPCSIWNNVLSEATIAPVDGSLLNLLDSHAEPTGAELHYQIAYFGWNSGLPRYGNFRLMDGWAGLADPGTRRIPEFISIRNLPDWVTRSGYDVYIYCDSNFVAPHARVMHFTIDGQRRVVKEQPSNFGGRFVLATSESVDEVRIGNYVVFRGLTSPHFTLTGGAGTRRAAVCGIQIVPESTREEVGARSATTDSPTRADEDARRPRSPDAASAVP